MNRTELPPVDEILSEFDNGKIPRSSTWHSLINGLYFNTEQVGKIEGWYNSTAEMYSNIQVTKNNIDIQYNQINTWHGEIDAWQQAVSQNTAITEANKTASEALKAATETAADNAAQSELNAGQHAETATTEAAKSVQARTDAETAENNAASSERVAGEKAHQSSEAATASANSSIISVQAKDAAQSAATEAEASKTASQSAATAAGVSKDAAKNSETRASNEADRSKLEADRSHNEADRAERAADSVDDIPDQSGHAGQFLGTDGTTADWKPIPEGLPPQTGNDGKFLQTDGTTAEWATISDSLPVGFIGAWPGKSAPMGWLWIEPITIYNRVDYPALYKHMKDNCPHLVIDGDTFKLCDSRGRGVIGYDPTGVIDPDNVGRELLTEQDDANRKLYGHIDSGVWYGSDPSFTMAGVFNTAGWKKINTRVDSAASSTGKLIFDSSRVVPTASVNRINNFNALWIIKAYDSVLEPEQLQAKAVIDQVNANAAELVNVKDITNKIGHVLIDFGPVNKNSSYVKPNPFGDKPVILKTELRIAGEWSESGHYNNYSNGNGRFTEGRTLGTNIHVITGNEAVLDDVQGRSGSAFNGRYLTTCNCRVHVLRVGV